MSVYQVRCTQILKNLETQRAEMLAELAEWSVHRLNFRPAPGAWSAVEVLDHIVRAEAGTMNDVQVGLKAPHLLGSEDRPGIAALDQALRSDQSFKVPAAATSIVPDSQCTLRDVQTRWETSRAELKSLLDPLTPADAHWGVFYHPFAGWMTFADVLDHFYAHAYHHRFQLARLRASTAGLS